MMEILYTGIEFIILSKKCSIFKSSCIIFSFKLFQTLLQIEHNLLNPILI